MPNPVASYPSLPPQKSVVSGVTRSGGDGATMLWVDFDPSRRVLRLMRTSLGINQAEKSNAPLNLSVIFVSACCANAVQERALAMVK